MGLMICCVRRDFAIATPMGIPTTIDNTVQTKIIEIVFIVSSHMPK